MKQQAVAKAEVIFLGIDVHADTLDAGWDRVDQGANVSAWRNAVIA